MNKWYLIFIFLLCPVFISSSARDAEVPYITTALEQEEGARIVLRYRAVHSSPMPTGGNSSNMKNSSSDVSIHPTIGELNTNVQLRIANQKLDPGRYDFGYNPEEKTKWSLVISRDGEPVIITPLVFDEKENYFDFLSLLFTPGITSRDFIFHCRYNNLYHAMRWTITGVPTSRSDVASSVPIPSSNQSLQRIPVGKSRLGAENLSDSSQIGSATGLNALPGAGDLNLRSSMIPRNNSGSLLFGAKRSMTKKAGSGAFRRIKHMAKEEQEQK